MNKTEESVESTATPETLESAIDPTQHALEVVQICELSGHPSAAISFLEKGSSMSEVRAELLRMKAADSDNEEKEISSIRGETHVGRSDGDDNVVVAACDVVVAACDRIADRMRQQMTIGGTH